jgi:hypothetical protein
MPDAEKSPLPERISHLDQASPSQARTCEENKGRTENRVIATAQVYAEDIRFPMPRQAAAPLADHGEQK